MNVRVVNHETTFGVDMDGLFYKQEQDLPEDFLAWCQAAKDASTAPAGETHLLYSVPTVVAELWLRDGFDIMREPAKRVIARLKQEGLDHFVCSKKAL